MGTSCRFNKFLQPAGANDKLLHIALSSAVLHFLKLSYYSKKNSIKLLQYIAIVMPFTGYELAEEKQDILCTVASAV